MIRLVPWLAVPAVLGLVFILGMMLDAQSRPQVHRPSGPLKQETVYALGRIEGATNEIALRPEFAGRVETVRVVEGQQVAAGDILLELDAESYAHEVELAEAELALAEARLARLISGAHPQERAEAAAMVRAKEAEREQAQLAWQRIDGLRQANAVSQQEADNHRTLLAGISAELEAARARLAYLESPPREDEVRIEEARVQAARARLDVAGTRLERTRLRAPVAGQVLSLNFERGEWSGPAEPEPAVVLADTSRFRVRAFVEELDASRVTAGMPVELRCDALAGRRLHGRVSRVSPRMGPKQLWSDRPTERFDTKTREVWIDLEESYDLVIGLRVDVIIGLTETEEAPDDEEAPPYESPETGDDPSSRPLAFLPM